MNQKGFSNIILVIIIVLAGAVVYFALVKKSAPVSPYQINQPATQTNLPTNTSPGGPLDTGWAEVKIISLNGEIAYLEVGKIRNYSRYPKATYPELKQGDKLDVRIFDFAPATSTEKRDGLAQREGELTTPAPSQKPKVGGKYLAYMSYCITDTFGGLACEYEGWSVALYHL